MNNLNLKLFLKNSIIKILRKIIYKKSELVKFDKLQLLLQEAFLIIYLENFKLQSYFLRVNQELGIY